MENDFNPNVGINYSLALAQIELLEALLETENPPYPWDTAALESEAYFRELEQQFVVEDWPDSEMAALLADFIHQACAETN